ncbi:hypothetical protein V7052_29390, partial [Bacillus wiedmannii]
TAYEISPRLVGSQLRIRDSNKIQAFQEEKERFAASAFKGLSEEERDNLLNMLNHIQENIKEL